MENVFHMFSWFQVSGSFCVKIFANEIIKLGLMDGVDDWTGGHK